MHVAPMLKKCIFADSKSDTLEEQDIQKIKAALDGTKAIAIVFHFNPDGDALGSALALYHYFKDEGYLVSVISPNPFPNFLQWMPGADQIIVAQEDLTGARKRIKEADMLFVVDMNAPHRAGQDLQNTIVKSGAFKVLIDHHVQPDIKCDVMYSTHLTSSASELVYNFLGLSSLYEGLLQSGSADTIASSIQRSQKLAQKQIEKFVKQYQD